MPSTPAAPSTVLFDESFDLADGGKLRLVVDFSTIQGFMTEYAEELKVARGLIAGDQPIDLADPVVRYLAATYSKLMSPTELINRAKQFYAKHLSQVQRDASILAFFATDETSLPTPARPYPTKTDAKKLPGLAFSMPDPEFNLDNALEQRLKRIMDAFASNLEIYARVMNITTQVNDRLLTLMGVGETDTNGFQPAASG